MRWKFVPLETWKFKTHSDLCHALYFGNWDRIESELKEKYSGKELSFQTVSKAHSFEQEFNVFEVIKDICIISQWFKAH